MWSTRKRIHAIYQIGHSFQPEAARASQKERRHPRRSLAQKPKGVDRVLPEVDVGKMNDAQRLRLDG